VKNAPFGTRNASLQMRMEKWQEHRPINKIGKVFWSEELPPDFSLACGLNLVFSARTSKVY
jgi:hypothetical protein